MSDEPKKRRLGLRQAGICTLVLLSAYVATYLAQLEVSDYYSLAEFHDDGTSILEVEPRYRIQGLEPIFRPLHRLDRMLRPNHWKREVLPPPWVNPYLHQRRGLLPAPPKN